MAAWQPSAGATLLIPSGAGKHLFVVLNHPEPFPGYGSQPCIVLVNVSSVRKDIPYDTTCRLPAGCHPFVVAESYVRYQDARIYRADELAARLAQGLFSPHEPMAREWLDAIRAGLRASPRTKRELKTLPI
jgi:hypothetical protein